MIGQTLRYSYLGRHSQPSPDRRQGLRGFVENGIWGGKTQAQRLALFLLLPQVMSNKPHASFLGNKGGGGGG
jgi:hypothetical protein